MYGCKNDFPAQKSECSSLKSRAGMAAKLFKRAVRSARAQRLNSALCPALTEPLLQPISAALHTDNPKKVAPSFDFEAERKRTSVGVASGTTAARG